MTSSRLEAFSDGVIAIIITIMVLELKVPHDQTLEGLRSLLPIFLGYALSFLLVAIYWVNHHHLLHLVKNVEPKTMWFNLLLLFWLSLTPFATEYMGAIFRRSSRKNQIATLCSFLSVPLAFLNVSTALGLLVLPVVMYFIPEREVEDIAKAQH